MTKTIPGDIRKAAKRIARATGTSHQAALDQVSRQHGHSGWNAVLALRRPQKSDLTSPLTALLDEAWQMSGTDIHIEPKDDGAQILIRVHRKRRPIRMLDRDRYIALKTAIEDHLDPGSSSIPRDGRMSHTLGDSVRSIQMASFPMTIGEKIVLRLPDRYVEGLTLEQLGIRDLEGWLQVCRSGPGIVMVSGTTSAGKSTTISRTVDRLRGQGTDVVAELNGLPFHEDRVNEMIDLARTKTVILETYGKSLDRAIADVMNRGLGNGVLTRLFRGGLHQELIPAEVGPCTMSSVVLPWGL